VDTHISTEKDDFMIIDDRAGMVTVQEILDTDLGPEAPAPYREQAPRTFGVADIAVERYTSREFLKLEYERMWARVWQWACCEEDIPNVGDHTVYGIGNRSILIVRSAPDEFKAFNNTCLHRGRQLKDGPGSSSNLTCPFHAWSWNLDGTMRELPCAWDFPQVDTSKMSLPEVLLERWAGNIFINLDPNAGPLIDHLDVVANHFKHFPLDEKFTVANVSKVVRANWKVVMEAFLEVYHVAKTHPTIVEFTADANSQYDVWQTANRMYSPMGSPSPHIGEIDEDAVYEAARSYYAGPINPDAPETLPNDQTARAALAAVAAESMRRAIGVDLTSASTSELLDAVEYWVFPNWCPWASITNGLQYRFRPYGDDPDMSIFDVRFMLPLPPGDARPPAPPVKHLGVDEPFGTVPELLAMGPLLDDDVSNLLAMQKGLKGAVRSGLVLGDYQESRIRHFHALLDECLGTNAAVTTETRKP
jgi:phenylpropionate dioxygenase-like ring-hydroxylating dioxygenase large terminal subunit